MNIYVRLFPLLSICTSGPLLYTFSLEAVAKPAPPTRPLSSSCKCLDDWGIITKNRAKRVRLYVYVRANRLYAVAKIERGKHPN